MSSSNETDVLDLLESIVGSMAEPLEAWEAAAGAAAAGGGGGAAAAAEWGAAGGSFRHFVGVYMRGQLGLVRHCISSVEQLRSALPPVDAC